MEREQYLAWRNSTSLEPLYEYYKEHYKGDKMIDIYTFTQAITHWPFIMEIYAKVTREYDIKFAITALQDLKTGTILKYL